MDKTITIALSKGRIFKDTLPLLAHAGIEPIDDIKSSRKLILATNQTQVKLVIIRASDVPTYVQYGAADVGVAGKDVLMEFSGSDGGQGLYEPLDLEIAKCRLMVAGPEVLPKITPTRLKIATKFVNVTKAYYAEQGQQVEIIKLYGSMELAPLVGLADRIVDVVDTGNTLTANGLKPLAHIADISSRLIVNRASLKMKQAVIKPFIETLREAVIRSRSA